jgi:archaeosortase A (PGF-CTERM-specific)
MKRYSKTDNIVGLLTIIVPFIFVIVGILFFPYDPSEVVELPIQTIILDIILFSSLFLLLIGFLLRKEGIANKIKIVGWILFAFFWSTQPNTLYYGEDGDFFNAGLCIISVFVLFYFAYWEWFSLKNKKPIRCLNWAAGAAAIAGLIYFGIDLTPLQMMFREIVAVQSAGLLNLFTGDVVQEGLEITWARAYIIIIFACTAVQSMVIFVGMIVPLSNVKIKTKIIGLAVTVIPIYFLNLVRNAVVVYLTGIYGHEFFPTAHNIIGKGGSLIALVILLFIVIKFIPELFDEILCLTDLPKQGGPIELFIKKHILRKNRGLAP